jgi:cardiolipin synthase
MTLASLVTLLRLSLVPLFGLWLARGDARAVPLFVALAAGDLVDGLLARTVSRATRLGALLDATADKALMLVAYVLGTAAGVLPPWLAAVVVGRDLLQGATWLSLGTRGRAGADAIRWEPSRVGKYATVAQAVTVVAALSVGRGRAALPLVQSWMVLTGVVTLVAGSQYLVRVVCAMRGRGVAGNVA